MVNTAPFPDLLDFWTTSLEECLSCGNSHIIVHPVDVDPGQCVRCGSDDVVRDFNDGPHAEHNQVARR